jgi:hypothetical protein
MTVQELLDALNLALAQQRVKPDDKLFIMGTEEGLLDTSIRRRLWILRVDNELLPVHAPNVEIPLPEDLLTEDEREELGYLT